MKSSLNYKASSLETHIFWQCRTRVVRSGCAKCWWEMYRGNQNTLHGFGKNIFIFVQTAFHAEPKSAESAQTTYQVCSDKHVLLLQQQNGMEISMDETNNQIVLPF